MWTGVHAHMILIKLQMMWKLLTASMIRLDGRMCNWIVLNQQPVSLWVSVTALLSAPAVNSPQSTVQTHFFKNWISVLIYSILFFKFFSLHKDKGAPPNRVTKKKKTFRKIFVESEVNVVWGRFLWYVCRCSDRSLHRLQCYQVKDNRDVETSWNPPLAAQSNAPLNKRHKPWNTAVTLFTSCARGCTGHTVDRRKCTQNSPLQTGNSPWMDEMSGEMEFRCQWVCLRVLLHAGASAVYRPAQGPWFWINKCSCLSHLAFFSTHSLL